MWVHLCARACILCVCVIMIPSRNHFRASVASRSTPSPFANASPRWLHVGFADSVQPRNEEAHTPLSIIVSLCGCQLVPLQCFSDILGPVQCTSQFIGYQENEDMRLTLLLQHAAFGPGSTAPYCLPTSQQHERDPLPRIDMQQSDRCHMTVTDIGRKSTSRTSINQLTYGRPRAGEQRPEG